MSRIYKDRIVYGEKVFGIQEVRYLIELAEAFNAMHERHIGALRKWCNGKIKKNGLLDRASYTLFRFASFAHRQRLEFACIVPYINLTVEKAQPQKVRDQIQEVKARLDIIKSSHRKQVKYWEKRISFLKRKLKAL